MLVAGPFGGQCQTIRPCPVFTSRSSNRTGGITASGSPTRLLACGRPQRVTADGMDQVDQTILLVESEVRVALNATPLAVLTPQPPTKPSAGVLLHHLPGPRDITQTEVVTPPDQ